MTSTALTESKKKLPILASASKSSTKLSNINTKNKIAEAAYYKQKAVDLNLVEKCKTGLKLNLN